MWQQTYATRADMQQATYLSQHALPFRHLLAAQQRSHLPARRVLLFGGAIIVLLTGGILIWFSIHGLLATPSAPLVPTPSASYQTVMFGIDAQHTHAISTEHTLTPQMVSHLVAGWTSFPADGSLFSSPIVADGMVYIGSLDGRLYAYRSTGCAQSSCAQSPCAPRWYTTPTRDLITAAPAVAAHTVFVSSNDGTLYAFDARGCAHAPCPPLWTSISTNVPLASSPAVVNNVVYVGSWDHRLYAFNANGCGKPSCQPLWTSIATDSIIESSPTIAGGVIYIGSVDEHLYAFDTAGCPASPCSPLWTSPALGESIESSAMVANGTVYIASLDHKLYTFHLPPPGS